MTGEPKIINTTAKVMASTVCVLVASWFMQQMLRALSYTWAGITPLEAAGLVAALFVTGLGTWVFLLAAGMVWDD